MPSIYPRLLLLRVIMERGVCKMDWSSTRRDDDDDLIWRSERSINHVLTSLWSGHPKSKCMSSHGVVSRPKPNKQITGGHVQGRKRMSSGRDSGWPWKVLDHLMGWCAWKVDRMNDRKSISLLLFFCYQHCTGKIIPITTINDEDEEVLNCIQIVANHHHHHGALCPSTTQGQGQCNTINYNSMRVICLQLYIPLQNSATIVKRYLHSQMNFILSFSLQ